jgi:hypothetical protein
MIMNKGNGKFHPRPGMTPHRGSTLSLPTAAHGGEWLTPRPVRFTPGKQTQYPLHRRLGEPLCRSGGVRKN